VVSAGMVTATRAVTAGKGQEHQMVAVSATSLANAVKIVRVVTTVSVVGDFKIS